MQACAFNADSKEAPFSIYADARGYYFTIPMWIVTKILPDRRSITVLTT